MRLNKIVSGAAAAAMLGTMMCTTAFAADYTDGDYTGEIHFLNANGSGITVCVIPSLSMRRSWRLQPTMQN